MAPVDPAAWKSGLKPGRVDAATTVATAYDAELKRDVDASVAGGGGQPTLVGFLAKDDTNNSEMYARMTRRACEKNGIAFELRRVERIDLEAAVIDANGDAAVSGIIVYYPVFGGAIDDYLRDVISVEKDVEGLNHNYRYRMYHNIRTLEGGKKCVLPCTPLACVKILETLGAFDRSEPVGRQLIGRTAIVYNRSEVVGRPLAAMLANDGARVYSVDVDGMLLYTAGAVPGTIRVSETSVEVANALRAADIVVSGVPAKGFSLPAEALREGAIAINFSQHANFGDGVDARCTFVPAIGKVTIAMLERNLIRLHANFRGKRGGAGLWSSICAPGGKGRYAAAAAAALALAAFVARRG